jgi:McrBC 5-methylcytosine restriction system component
MPVDVLPREIMLLEYEPYTEPCLRAALFEQRDCLKSYLTQGWLTQGFENDQPCVKASHYVGLLPYSYGGRAHLLLVAPKGSRTNPQLGLLRFLELIALGSGDNEFQDTAGIEGSKGASTFILFLTGYYSQLLQELCRRDFRSYYRAEQGELRSRLRGRLHMSGYLRNRLKGKAHRLSCRWEEFTPDNWDNRILWAAACGLKRAALSLDAQAAAFVGAQFQLLTPWFSSVSEVPITRADLYQSRLGRTSRYYRRALGWARLIIQGTSLPLAGGQAPPLVLDANDAFERFAEVIARSALPDNGWQVAFQKSYSFLTGQQNQERRPDILISAPRGIHAVGDAKYKDVLENVPVEQLSNITDTIRSGIKESDWNQLYVYMRLTQASYGFFVVPFWQLHGPEGVLLHDFAFLSSPVDRSVQLAVLGINLLQPLRQAKQQAAELLKKWLHQPPMAKP